MAHPITLPEGYTTAIIPPPGPSIAPNGFPTPPLPAGAPPAFIDTMRVRIAVFCEEQKCSLENELDEDDSRSWSWVIYSPSKVPVTTIRVVPPPHASHPNGYFNADEEPYIKLTRFATLSNERGKGLGKALIETALKWMGGHAKQIGEGWKGMVLVHAQVSVEKMYERIGFVTDERLGRWDEEGIEHLGMWKRIRLEG